MAWWLSGKESSCQCRRLEFNPWVRKIPCRSTWQPTPVFLPRESHRQRSLEGYSPWGLKESDMTHRPHTHEHGIFQTAKTQIQPGQSMCLNTGAAWLRGVLACSEAGEDLFSPERTGLEPVSSLHGAWPATEWGVSMGNPGVLLSSRLWGQP